MHQCDAGRRCGAQSAADGRLAPPIVYLHEWRFKYEAIPGFVDMLKRGDDIASWDVTDAFHYIRLAQWDQVRLASWVSCCRLSLATLKRAFRSLRLIISDRAFARTTIAQIDDAWQRTVASEAREGRL